MHPGVSAPPRPSRPPIQFVQVVGPAGPAGPPGPTGPAGPAGADGEVVGGLAPDGDGSQLTGLTKSQVGLSNVDDKSSATIRGEITSGNVTTALGYTPTSVTGLTGTQSVAAFKTGLSLAKGDVGLGNVDNTSDAGKPVSTAQQTALDAKVPTSRTISNGFGISGGGALSADRTLAVSLTTAEAFCTATTSISAAAYADITGASISLAAGTWLILGFANFSAVNANAMLHLAITDSSNVIVAEGSQGVPASGSANVAQNGNVSIHAIVTPGSTTTYKLRGARGNTTLTTTVVVMDGAGTATTNNLTDNSDKGTSIRAVRIA